MSYLHSTGILQSYWAWDGRNILAPATERLAFIPPRPNIQTPKHIARHVPSVHYRTLSIRDRLTVNQAALNRDIAFIFIVTV